MKSFLYVGAMLMIGAIIYGFVDYKKSGRNSELDKMYSAPETKDPSVPRQESGKNESLLKTEDAGKKYSDVAETNNVTVSTNAAARENSEKKIKKSKRKKFNYKLFSRAPLEDRYLEKKVKPEEPAKAGITSSEKKEQ